MADHNVIWIYLCHCFQTVANEGNTSLLAIYCRNIAAMLPKQFLAILMATLHNTHTYVLMESIHFYCLRSCFHKLLPIQ